MVYIISCHLNKVSKGVCISFCLHVDIPIIYFIERYRRTFTVVTFGREKGQQAKAGEERSLTFLLECFKNYVVCAILR